MTCTISSLTVIEHELTAALTARNAHPDQSDVGLEPFHKRALVLEDAIVERKANNLTDVAVKLRWMLAELQSGCPLDDLHHTLIQTALEGVDCISTPADPIFAVIEELWSAQLAYNNSGDTPDGHPTEIRNSQAVKAFLKARAATAAGMAAKTEALAEFYRKVELDPDIDVLDELAGYFRSLGHVQTGVQVDAPDSRTLHQGAKVEA